MNVNNCQEINFNDSNLKFNELSFGQFVKFHSFLTCLIFIIIIIGLISNLLSFVVFVNPKTRSSFNIFMSSLIACAFIALVLKLINLLIQSQLIHNKIQLNSPFLLKVFVFTNPVSMTFDVGYTWLTVSVSINQFVNVAFSNGFRENKNKKLKEKNIKRAKCIVMGIISFSIVFCVPYWLRFKYSDKEGIIKTDLGKSLKFDRIVHYYMYLPFACVIPFMILVVTNFYLLAKLKLVGRNKKRLNSTHSAQTAITEKKNKKNLKHKKVSKSANDTLTKSCIKKKSYTFERTNKRLMLIFVIFFFLICHFPILFLNLFEQNSLIFRYLLEITKFLSVLNLSFNFAFFYLFSAKFRKSLKNILLNA